ncbi:MAG: racemase [Tissierellia bacterium]|nr:racemase [Tissierellia bacterium]
MKIAVIAGTKVDTQFGADILNKYNVETVNLAMSENPNDQTALQYYSKEQLNELFNKKIEYAKKNGAEAIFLYCNSLSSIVDYKKSQIKFDIKIVTPLEVYENVRGDYIAIMAANGASVSKIDQIITKNNKKTISIGNLELVKEIEKKITPKKIANNMNLEALFNYFKKIHVDKVLLGCTHLYYIKDVLKDYGIEIIDPTQKMLEELGIA